MSSSSLEFPSERNDSALSSHHPPPSSQLSSQTPTQSSSPAQSHPSPTPTSNPLSSFFPPNRNPFSSSSSSPLSSPSSSSPSVLSSLSTNPLFSAGAGLAGVGVVLAGFRRFSSTSISLFRRFYTVSLEVPSRDRSYPWLLSFITKQISPSSRHFGVETSFSQQSNGAVNAKFDMIPSTGYHFFMYHKKIIIVSREREKSMVDLNSGAPWETVTLYTLGSNYSIFSSLLNESKLMAMKKSEGKTIIYTTMGVEWRPFGPPRTRRPLHSVILDKDISNNILSDMKEFIQNQSWYLDRGIPYRRGYLLYGTPGNGKSSFIFSLAGELEYNIGIINLHERGLTDDKLHYCLMNLPPKTIVLLEDVDAAFRESAPAGNNNNNLTHNNTLISSPIRDGRDYVGVTFSGLLNALDGVASTEERIVFMTTNHKERLDSALIRPGRIDMEIEISTASEYQLEMMWKRFFPEEEGGSGEDRGKIFASTLWKEEGGRGRRISMAELQGFFLIYKNDANGAWRDYKQLVLPKEERKWKERD